MDESTLLDIIGTEIKFPRKCGRVIYKHHNMVCTCSRLIVENNNDAESCNLCQRTYILDNYDTVEIKWK
jgi:hypothetical protein